MAGKKQPAKKSEPVESRVIEVVKVDGTILHITLEKSWKITFGRFQMGYSGSNANIDRDKQNGVALRIYETKERQLACFRDVVSFRDLSIPMDVVYSPEKKQQQVAVNGKWMDGAVVIQHGDAITSADINQVPF